MNETCSDPMRVSPHVRRFDAYGALLYLQEQPFVKPGRVGIIGWDHGGWTVRKTIRKPWLNVLDLPHGGFGAAIAFYPNCQGRGPFYPPFLILIGEKDKWTRPGVCRQMIRLSDEESVEKGEPVILKVYPGAYHGFDRLTLPQPYQGHMVGRHPEAAAQAEEDVKTFLAQYLKGEES